MNCKIPFTKDIDFEKKLSEITSISLEHEINVVDNNLKGNFIISGDFKSHEVSVNKEPFSYILPFEIALTPDIDTSTIEFLIEDFTYEVLPENILRVNIDFNVIASKKEDPQEDARIFKEPTDLFLDNVMLDDISNEKTEIKEDKIEVIEDKTEEKEVVEKNVIEEKKATETEKIENEENVTMEDTIINNFQNEEEYATYHIHMVSDGETVETICTMYNSNMNVLSEYNDLSNLSVGSKIIIPDINE